MCSSGNIIDERSSIDNRLLKAFLEKVRGLDEKCPPVAVKAGLVQSGIWVKAVVAYIVSVADI